MGMGWSYFSGRLNGCTFTGSKSAIFILFSFYNGVNSLRKEFAPVEANSFL